MARDKYHDPDRRMRRTLREMVDSGDIVRVRCTECGRDRNMALAALVSERDLEQDVSTQDLARRIRCRRCDRKRAEIMAASHVLGPRKDDLTRSFETNILNVPCPACGSALVSRSCSELRPRTAGPIFMPFTQFHQYTCEECMNWWIAE